MEIQPKRMLRLAVFASFLVFSPAIYGAPHISWSRGQISRIMPPTFVGTEHVQFIGNTALTNINVVVVPQLRPYVQVTPSHFDVIQAGTAYSLTLSFHIPADALVGSSASGTIRVVHAQRTLPTTLKLFLGISPDAVRQSDFDKFVGNGTLVYPVNEILAILSPGSSLADAQQLASAIRGDVVGFVSEVNVYQILLQTTNVEDLEALIQKLRTSSPFFVVGI